MMHASADPVWDRIRKETEAEVAKEPILASFLYSTILNHSKLEAALSFHLAHMLDSATAPSLLLRGNFDFANFSEPLNHALHHTMPFVNMHDFATAKDNRKHRPPHDTRRQTDRPA